MMRARVRPDSDSQQWHLNMFLNNTAGLVACVLFLFLAMAGAWYAAVSQLDAKIAEASTLDSEIAVGDDTSVEGNTTAGGKAHAAHGTKLSAKALSSKVSAASFAARKSFLEALSNTLSQQGVKVRVFPESGMLRISAKSVVFPVGQALLKPESLGNFDRVGAVLEKALACVKPSNAALYKAPASMASYSRLACSSQAQIEFACSPEFKSLSLNAVQLEGHADARPISGGHFKDNLELSSARAESLLRRMQSCQPGLSQFANAQGNPLLNVAAHSTQQPAEKENPLADANRRVELRFLMEGE